jgi:hypothetical protein
LIEDIDSLNTVSEDDDVPEVERYFQTIKERTRAIWNTVLFELLPNWIISDMVTS